jgi:hypothetical protein
MGDCTAPFLFGVEIKFCGTTIQESGRQLSCALSYPKSVLSIGAALAQEARLPDSPDSEILAYNSNAISKFASDSRAKTVRIDA